jgi:hypothetical protein
MRISAQKQCEMRSRQRLLKIRGSAVHEHLGVGQTIARARSAPLPGLSFDDGWTAAIANAKL